jgi:hypothetical protein
MRNRFIVRAVVATAVIAAAVVCVERPGLEVRIVQSRSGRTLWHRPAAAGARLELRYQHSVEQTPIVEVFRVEPDGLWFVEMRFVSQGAGLPTEGYVREGDHFVLRRPRRVGTLPLLVSGVAAPRLVLAGSEVDLVAVAGDGTSVVLAARRAPRFRWPEGR